MGNDFQTNSQHISQPAITRVFAKAFQFFIYYAYYGVPSASSRGGAKDLGVEQFEVERSSVGGSGDGRFKVRGFRTPGFRARDVEGVKWDE